VRSSCNWGKTRVDVQHLVFATVSGDMDYVRYLSSKRSVDDRAINAQVLHGFCELLGRNSDENTLRIVEVGAGIGAMLVRLWRANAFFAYSSVEYTLIDIKAEVLVHARELILREICFGERKQPGETDTPMANATMTDKLSLSVSGTNSVHRSGGEDEGSAYLPVLGDVHLPSTQADSSAFRGAVGSKQGLPRIRVRFVVGDGFSFLKTDEHRGQYDAVIAAAVLDLFNIQPSLDTLFGCLDRARGPRAFYLPVNFDGVTSFQPQSAAGTAFDARVERLFHNYMGFDDMDGGRKAETGRRLRPALAKAGATGIVSGSSAWVVAPSLNRAYEEDERFFLQCIFEFVRDTLQGDVVMDADDECSRDACVPSYLASRRRQLEDGELTYIAHNMDYCGQVLTAVECESILNL
jgi:hypothetical protein